MTDLDDAKKAVAPALAAVSAAKDIEEFKRALHQVRMAFHDHWTAKCETEKAASMTAQIAKLQADLASMKGA